MLAPDLIRLVPQRHPHEDCAVSTIATMTGSTYEDALVACSAHAPDVLASGMTTPQMRRAIESLGRATSMLRKGFDATEHTGILHVFKGKSANNATFSHVVILWHGRVIDGNGEFWLSLDDYLDTHKLKSGSLLVVT